VASGESRSWYLGVSATQVTDRALLVGDRSRIDRIAARLGNPTRLNEDRGLRAVTGTYRGFGITAAAFGMGAPIAAIVLEELASLGTSTFLRLGTAMALAPSKLGEMLLAEGALTGESTSRTYVPPGFPAVADFTLQAAVRAALQRAGCKWHSGLFASYDGFYTEMLAVKEERREAVARRVKELRRLGVLAMDMETSAVLAIGRALGTRTGSFCLASVAWEGPLRLDRTERERGEDLLVEIGLDALVTVDVPE
jgi:uridine phosphorylase